MKSTESRVSEIECRRILDLVWPTHGAANLWIGLNLVYIDQP